MSFRIERMRVPSLAEPIRIEEDHDGHTYQVNAPDITVEDYVLIAWDNIHDHLWPSAQDTIDAVQSARARFGPSHRYVLSVTWPKPGDMLMGVEVV